MSASATDRALLYLYNHAGRDGVGCDDVGGAVWSERKGRVTSSGGGGDYAAQMLLGRLKKAGLVEHAPSEGSSRWRLTAKGLRRVNGTDAKAPRQPIPSPPRKTSTAPLPCVCGDSVEEHGHDDEYPGSTACSACDDCIAYEADHDAQKGAS